MLHVLRGHWAATYLGDTVTARDPRTQALDFNNELKEDLWASVLSNQIECN